MKTKQGSHPGSAFEFKAFGSALLLGASLLLGGCANKSQPATALNIAGDYTLVAVNSIKVPTTIEHGGAKILVRSGAFTIHPDGTCRSTMVFVPPNGTEVSRVVDASYTQNGSRLVMKWKGAGITTGRVNGNQFSMENEDMLLSYQK